MPEDRTFPPTPQWAVESVRDMHPEARLACKYMVADGLDGNSPAWIAAAEPGGGKLSLVSMPSETRGWVPGPVPQPKRSQYKGEARAKRVVRHTEKAPLAVAVLANGLHACCWSRRKVSAGTTGPLEDEFPKRPGMWCQESRPDNAGWLVMQRTLGETPTYAYSRSNAPGSPR